MAAPAGGIALQGDLPETGDGALAVLNAFQRDYDHLLSASAGPRYLGFVTGGTTPAALVGDWLAAAFDQNAQFNNDTVAVDIEQQALRWLGELLGLTSQHTGIVVTGATMANFTGMAIARQWLGQKRGVDIAQSGLHAMPPVRVISGSAHSSIGKVLAMLGVGRDALVGVPSLPGREAVDIAALEASLEMHHGEPIIVNANAGIVNTGDFDDIAAIAALKKKHDFWLHVDAAFGAFAAVTPEFANYVAGIEQADSVTVDGHKWLNVPYDSGYLFTKHLEEQVDVFMNISPYLPAPAVDPRNVLHLGPENSRRWRALPLWFALKAYGRKGIQEIVARDCEMAAMLGKGIDALPGYELLSPVNFNIVCFTLADNPEKERVIALRDFLVDRNAAYLSPTVHDGKPALRAAFCNWRTKASHVEAIVAALEAFQAQ